MTFSVASFRMTDWTAAQRQAAKTARWAVTMTKVRIAKAVCKTKWQLVTFVGPSGGESVGIVDLMAIRKNHAHCEPPAKRGDSFQIVLIQVKGGSAPFPTADEVKRLRLVGRTYRAKAILLAQWKRGTQVRFYCLRKGLALKPADYWSELDSLAAVFH
jgi:hypothetical protein